MRIAIIGGGIGGLAAAFRIRQQCPDAAITLIEQRPHCGGVIGTTTIDGVIAEHGPDSIVRTKPAGLRLLTDLGLGSRIIATQPDARTGLVLRGRTLISIPAGLYLLAPGKMLPFLRSPLISWAGKMRMSLDLVLPARRRLAREESLAAFVRRRLGHEALARIAQPLVSGIYTADPEQLSVAATMPLFLTAETEHGSVIRAMAQRADTADASGPRYGLFVSLRGGLGELTEALVDHLKSCALRSGVAAAGLTRHAQGWQITLASGEVLDADHCVLAQPAWAMAPLLMASEPQLAKQLSGIPYAGVATYTITADLAQCHPLPAAAGFVVPACEQRTLIACTFAHRKYPDRTPAGQIQLRAFAGGALRPADLELDDAELTRRLRADLTDIVGFHGEPRFSELHRWPRSMCQPVIGHRERTASIRAHVERIAGLHLISNGLEGVGIPDLAEQAEQVAARISAATVEQHAR